MENELACFSIFMGVTAFLVGCVLVIPKIILEVKIKKVKVGAKYKSIFKGQDSVTVTILEVDRANGTLVYKFDDQELVQKTTIESFVQNWDKV